MLFDPGACCDCEGGSTITVVKCGSLTVGIPGFGVKIQQGSTVYFDGVTDVDGKVKFTLPTAGVSYTVILTAGAGNPRYGNVTRTFTPASLPYQGVQAAPAATGYVCAFPGVDPVRDTLIVTLADGDYVAGYVLGSKLWLFSGLGKTAVTPSFQGPLTCGLTRPAAQRVAVEHDGSDIRIVLGWGESHKLGDGCGFGGSEQYHQETPQGGAASSSWGEFLGLPFYESGSMSQTAGLLAPPPGSLGYVVVEAPL